MLLSVLVKNEKGCVFMRKTRKEMFTAIMALEAVQQNQEYVSFLEKEIAKCDRKTVTKKPTPTQVENEKLKNAILEFLSGEAENCFTVTQLTQQVNALDGRTTQKVSALMRQLLLDGLVVRTTNKNKTYFSISK